jgi:hypothetical protein
MPKAKWTLTARTKDGSELDSPAALGRPHVSISVYSRDDLNRRLRAAKDRPDLTVTVTPDPPARSR